MPLFVLFPAMQRDALAGFVDPNEGETKLRLARISFAVQGNQRPPHQPGQSFVHDLWTFLVIIGVLLALTVAQTFLQERLKFRLREWITRHLLVEWLKPLRVYQLSFAGPYGHNPDQRIQEDTRLLGDYSADLGCGIVYSLLQIIAFVGVLWALSAQAPGTIGVTGCAACGSCGIASAGGFVA
jgi:ABC-type uncharacterized transport system fused permease/ATPase subunit